jgi:hypothetical protein
MALLTLVHSQSTGRITRLVEAGVSTFPGSLCHGAKECIGSPFDAAMQLINKFKRSGLKGAYDVYLVDTQSPYVGIGIDYYGYECKLWTSEGYKLDSCNRPAYEMFLTHSPEWSINA